MDAERKLRAAAVQLAPIIGELAESRARAASAIADAAGRGAELVVLPELCVSGYVFTDQAEARTAAEPLSGPTVDGWQTLAARHGLTIVGGVCELGEDGTLHNTAVVVERSGVVGAYRKTHLWDREAEIFLPGAVPSPVFETACGRIGIAVCYDSFFPESMRRLALAGAEVIAVPMNSLATVPPIEPQPVEISMCVASAAANRVFVIEADRTGHERGVDWAEASVIVDPDGRLLAGPAEGEATLIAELDLALARDKSFGERNDVIADRREELYLSPASPRGR